MSLLNTLRRLHEPIRRNARYDKLTINPCLEDTRGDHFFAVVTYFTKEVEGDVIVEEITAAFPERVQIKDYLLFEQCQDVVRSHFDQRLIWKCGKVERITEDV